jgi:hypothetical protein
VNRESIDVSTVGSFIGIDRSRNFSKGWRVVVEDFEVGRGVIFSAV